MSRRARLTVLELGASPTAWVSSRGLETDDWLVVAQQSDEPASVFSERVLQRARRLIKGACIETIDLYTAQERDDHGFLARRAVIEALAGYLVEGGRLTLWSPSTDARIEAELAAILAQFRPVFGKRPIALKHQTCEVEERSGVRHALIAAMQSESDDFELNDFG